MIRQLSGIFGSKTKAQEIIFLIRGAKEVVRHGFYENELQKINGFCSQQNLSIVKSRFKVLLADGTSADETFYSNKGIRIKEDDPRHGMYFFYISTNEKSALLASYYELIGDHRRLGMLLGYPECCIDFFCSQFSTQNPNLEQVPTNLFTNLTKRQNDTVLLSHFPCSSDCRQSIVLAKKYLAVLKKADPERADEIIKALELNEHKLN